LVAGIAAATGTPPPSTVAFQPFGMSLTDSATRCGASSAFCSLIFTVVVSPARTAIAGKSVVSQRPAMVLVSAARAVTVSAAKAARIITDFVAHKTSARAAPKPPRSMVVVVTARFLLRIVVY